MWAQLESETWFYMFLYFCLLNSTSCQLLYPSCLKNHWHLLMEIYGAIPPPLHLRNSLHHGLRPLFPQRWAHPWPWLSWFTTSRTSYQCSTITPLLGVQLNLNLKSTKLRQLGDVFEKSPIFAAGKKTINKKWEPLPHRIHGFSVYLPSNVPSKINQI